MVYFHLNFKMNSIDKHIELFKVPFIQITIKRFMLNDYLQNQF